MASSLRGWVWGAAMSGAAQVAAVADPTHAVHGRPVGNPFAIEATALVPLDDESSVSIVGIRGRITTATVDERELRVISRTSGSSGAELPVGLWQDRSRIILAPAPGDPGVPRNLYVEVPKGFAIAVDAEDSEVVLQSERGDIQLRGDNVRATIQAAGGSVVAELLGGTLTVRDSREARLRLRATAASVSAMSGDVNVHAVGGTLSLSAIGGSTDIESDGTPLSLDGLSGAVRVKAQKTEAKIFGMKGGGELSMVGTPLKLKDGKGDITVISDAPVEFLDMAATLHFDMYGGSLRGKGNDGILEVRTRNTAVEVEAISDGMRIQGEGLTARIVDVGGELYIETTISDVVVDRAGSVVLRVERGNVTIQRATGAVQATVVGGDVRILDGSGPVTLDLERGDGEVSWASLSGDKDSKLTNTTGNLRVRFPSSGPCRVEAKTKYGRIESDLPTVVVMDDSASAQGPVNGGFRPIVHITATGDIRLESASSAP